jgi:hypothetical protein
MKHHAAAMLFDKIAVTLRIGFAAQSVKWPDFDGCKLRKVN